MNPPIDPARCPLCGEANDCQLAAGRAKCWCFETPVPPEVLARVPLDAQGIACVCPRCAAGGGPSGDTDRRRALAMRWARR